MQASYVQEGCALDYTPLADVSAGTVVVVGDTVGVVNRDIKAGQLGARHLCGVFSGVKDSAAIGDGAKVYWKPDGNPLGGTAGSGCFTATATGAKFAGYAAKAAAADAATVLVRFVAGL